MDIRSDIANVTRRIAEITGRTAFNPAGQDERLFSSLAGNARPLGQFEGLIRAGAKTWGVDGALIKAVIANESGFDPNATSPTGAQGLMQLEPATAAELGVVNAYDPAQNIFGGTRYIRGLLDRFHGDLRLALAAYNAGAGSVEKYGGVPPYAETQHYVERVLESYQKYKVRP